jgi:HlyD family secretion protein
MPSRSRWRFRPPVWLQLFLASVMVAAVWSAMGAHRAIRPTRPLDSIEWALVRRAEMDTRLLVGGDLKPAKETTVTCQVEDITDSDGTIIVSMVDNGTHVKIGDKLCRLDSSQLEELAREEEITVIQVRSTYVQACLALDVARIALHEYQDGLVTNITKDFEVRIALARSDAERQADRVVWTEAMAAKGYCSQSQLLTERQALEKARHELRKAEGESQVFQHFRLAKEVSTLSGQVQTAENNHRLEAARLQAQEDRLAYIRKQIENCHVRAPHDGIAIHARRSWRSEPLAPGVRVYQGQDLFKLPDPALMDVEVSIHETMGPRVREGMRASVRIASIADRKIAGRVVSIIPMPIQNDKEWDEKLRHYLARVRLDETPRGILPTMSAVVEIDTGRIPDALVIPVEAMSIVDGSPFCYVMVPRGVERRAITPGRSTIDLLEVTAGLDEGERIVSRFPSVDGLPTR